MLRKEFHAIDANGDGQITKPEMLQFLGKKGIDEEHRVQIVDELFQKCDEDNDGVVDLNEFVHHYIDTKN